MLHRMQLFRAVRCAAHQFPAGAAAAAVAAAIGSKLVQKSLQALCGRREWKESIFLYSKSIHGGCRIGEKIIMSFYGGGGAGDQRCMKTICTRGLS